MVVRRDLKPVQVDWKGMPSLQGTFDLMNKVCFADRISNREHQRDMRIDQLELRVIFPSELIDRINIDLGIMNQCVEHKDI